VQYLDQNRNTFAAAFSSDPDFYNDIVDGSKRTLIRITVIGRVVRNGRSSTARVAREFEVVPKCCKRSFGSQGAVNWGRDLGVCAITRPGGGRPVLGGLNGGKVSGSSGGFKIVDENGNSNIKAVCWAGNGTLPVGVSSDLSGTPNPDCATTDMAIGNEKGNKKNNTTSKSSVSFNPELFPLALSTYASGVSPQAGRAREAISIGNNKPRYIYFDSVAQETRLCDISGSTLSNCTRLDGRALGTSATPATSTSLDPCYIVTVANPTASPPSPYPEVNCRLKSI
jgi:hypothetical protein